jgi:hypothetical protein
VAGPSFDLGGKVVKAADGANARNVDWGTSRPSVDSESSIDEDWKSIEGGSLM